MTSFDPYHKWLGIPPKEQPAGPRRLLGISEDENDPQVVREAALRQTAFVRQFSIGEHGEHAERILGELAEARDSILSGKIDSPTKAEIETPSPSETPIEPGVEKTAPAVAPTAQAPNSISKAPVIPTMYVAVEKPGSQRPQKTPAALYDAHLRRDLQTAPEEDPLTFMTEQLAAISSKPATQSRSRSGKPIWKEPWAIPALAGGIVVLLLIMMLFGSVEEPQDRANQSSMPSPQQFDYFPGQQRTPESTSTTANNEAAPDKVAVAPPLAVAPFDTAEAKAHQAAWAKYLGVPVEYTSSVDMEFALVPPGKFIMGSPEDEVARHDDEFQHGVSISKALYMQTTEVSQGQWKAVMGTEPWRGQRYAKAGSNYAAAFVSWDGAVAYCKKLSEKEGKTYRLPTEAEWEYACRAGTEARWSFGNDEKELGDYAWYLNNAQGIGDRYAHQIKQKKSNAFGLYDMHGNVWEWCHDYYEEDYYKQSPTSNPQGPESGSSRVLRGGSWSLYTRNTRSADRDAFGHDSRNYFSGFRVVRELENSAAKTVATERLAAKLLPASLQEGLVAYYPFNGNANDESGNGHHGDVKGAISSSDRHGKANHAYLFDGVDDYIEIKENATLGPRFITLSLWMWTNSPGTLLYKVRYQDAGAEQYNLQIQAERGRQNPALCFGIKRNSNGRPGFGWQKLFSRDHIITNNWAMVTTAFDGLLQRIYINGELNSINDMTSQGKKGIDDLAGGNLQIGRGWLRYQRLFKGQLDDIRIYNRALSEAEVKALYEFEKP